MLEIDNLSAFYGNSRALQNVTLEVGDAGFLSVLGRNGVGKTALLRAIVGLMDKTEGSIRLDGEEIAARRVVLVLATVGEGVDLRVAIRRAVGRGEHELIERVVARVGPFRHGRAHPNLVRARLIDEKSRARTADRLGDAVGLHREPGRVHLGEYDEPGAAGRRPFDHRRETGEVLLRPFPDDVVLDTGDHHLVKLFKRVHASSSTSVRLQHANRTSGEPAGASS